MDLLLLKPPDFVHRFVPLDFFSFGRMGCIYLGCLFVGWCVYWAYGIVSFVCSLMFSNDPSLLLSP
jgi:hypothetical protein